MTPTLDKLLRGATMVFWSLAALTAAGRLVLVLWVAGPVALWRSEPWVPVGYVVLLLIALAFVVGLLRRWRYAKPLGIVLGALTLLWALALPLGVLFFIGRMPVPVLFAAALFAGAGLVTMAVSRSVASSAVVPKA